jgi:hypothetical protein
MHRNKRRARVAMIYSITSSAATSSVGGTVKPYSKEPATAQGGEAKMKTLLAAVALIAGASGAFAQERPDATIGGPA